MNQKIVTAWMGILLAALLLLSACSFSMPGQQAASKATPIVTYTMVNESNVQVEGRLIPNQSIRLAFQSGGRVKELLVSEGSAVQAGQLIARLDGADQLQATVENARFELLSAQQEIDSLNENYAAALANAQQQLAQAKIDLKKAQDDRTSMIYRRASDATLNGLRADVIMAQQELDNAQNYYDHHQYGDKLVAAQALSQLSAAQKARDRAQYNLDYASDLPDKNEIDKADANLMIAQAKVDTARINLDRLAGGPDSKTLALAEARLQKAQIGVKATQADLDNLDIKAPFSGKIVDLNISQGEQVSPGQAIATLADFSRWIVETNDLTELKVVQLKLGQKATLVADALPNQKLTGSIERISNGYIEKQGDITYTVRIVVDQMDERLRWGMTFSVQLDTTSSAQAANQAELKVTLAPTAAAEAAQTPSPASVGASAAATGSAETTVKGYFAALEKQDYQTAASFLSNYSLVAEKTTREAAAGTLQVQIAQGTRWSDLAVKESRAQDSDTTLIHVLYQRTTKDAKTGADTKSQQDEWWPVRSENGQWLYNWNNIVDFRGLDIAGQTTGGLTINPVQISRYTDRFKLVLFVQNKTNEPIVLGQPNEIMALFTFGGQTMEAEKAQLIFDHQHSYPDVKIEVKGDFPNYPDKVEIRKWKNYQVPPWYTFILANHSQ